MNPLPQPAPPAPPDPLLTPARQATSAQPTRPAPHRLDAIQAAAAALEENRERLRSGFGHAAERKRPGNRWRALLGPFAAHRPWLLVGGAALAGGLLGLLMGATPRRALRRGLALLVGPALWGALQAESQRLVQQLIRTRLFASVAPILRAWETGPTR